mmetsp:Transcript_68919/g.193357  ORF Transcript_68919/g.193357 Transcript_68919/m.193357 type:complete len:296 (-) Transcript_68919:83-970(-)
MGFRELIGVLCCAAVWPTRGEECLVSLGEDTSTLLQTGGADLWEEPHVADDTHFVLYFVAMQGNTKHNLSDYVMFLTTTCTRLARKIELERGIRATLVGSVAWVRDNVPACASLEQGSELSLGNLQYKAEQRRMWRNCTKKHSQGDIIPAFSNMAQIWLNKLPVLCKAAGARPSGTTVLVDANLYKSNRVRAALTASSRLSPGRLMMPSYVPATAPDRIPTWPRPWFGQPTCTRAPYYQAKFLAARGRDCPKLLAAWHEALRVVASDTSCGCYDEEIVFGVMKALRPDMFQRGNE